MSYEKVLVAFDGSEGSVEALNHAMIYVKENEGQLTAVHVVDANQPDVANAAFITSATIPGAIQPENRQNRQIQEGKSEAVVKGEQVLKGANSACNKRNIQTDTDVLEGDPAKKICEYAEINEMDLIVIGHRGISGLKKLVQGSVSQKVTERASCPVLVIK